MKTFPYALAALALLMPLSKIEAAPAIAIEAEDFSPYEKNGWRVLKNGGGNDMVDAIGFNHISGERLLSAPANAKNARTQAKGFIPASGAYRVWSRFEQPTGTENRFRVEIRQGGKVVASHVMGKRDAPKYFFGFKTPVGQYDASWGSEGLVEQSFDIQNLQKGEAEISLIAEDQSALQGPRANRNVDFLFLTQDMTDSWREKFAVANNRFYPILDAALEAMPIRYFLRLSSPVAQQIEVRYQFNRAPFYPTETTVKLEAKTPSDWLPLSKQDVAHFTTLQLFGPAGQGLTLRAELASSPHAGSTLRAIDWNDPQFHVLEISLPPYPKKYAGESIQTVEEQYRAVANYLKTHPSKVGREPNVPLAWGGWIPIWQRGRVADAAADVYFGIGLRAVNSLSSGSTDALAPAIEIARERFQKRGIAPQRSVAIGSFRFPPTSENIAKVKTAATASGVLPLLQRFDYGDEIQFSEWLAPLSEGEIKSRFADWQKKRGGKIEYSLPDSSAKSAIENPKLYVDSLRFFEETAVDYVANQAQEIPKELGKEVLYGANFAVHPFYYPETAKYVKWFRPTEKKTYAANFGRHSEYFWQIGLPGPLINSYIAEHFRAGMKHNPDALLLQYTEPHSPGNSDKSFRRSAFSHLAHGARGLDFFGVGLQSAWTENYIDFRDPARYAAIHDITRSMATIEDILPVSKVAPSRVALILSDSTERWDFAGVAQDKATFDVAGADYKKMRLAFHQERVGIYYALTHASRTPDLLIEGDIQNGDLKDYDVAYWVGDCATGSTLAALEKWIENGGHLIATAGALRNDEYKNPTENGLKLFGLQSAKLDARQWFFRPQIELPQMKPLDAIKISGGKMPVLALKDEIIAAPNARVRATFSGGRAAIIENVRGKGRTTFIAALPGVAYLWRAYQNAGGQNFVPTRGPSSHLDLTGFDEAAKKLIVSPALGVLPAVEARGAKIDARLLVSPKGYAVPLANYEANTEKPITLLIRVPNIQSISSAAKGKLKFALQKDGAARVEYAPGVGDILRIEVGR